MVQVHALQRKNRSMTVLKIVTWPATVLETRSVEVTTFGESLRQFVADMQETMADEGGIGLAANQVGNLRRVVVIRIPWDNSRYSEQEEKQEPWHNKAFTFINPVIKQKSGKCKWQEGCLSFPGIFEYVDRAAEVTVSAKDEFGKVFELSAGGLMAICLQHEIDHIDGIVFINRMTRLKSSLVRKKLQKLALERADLE